MKPAAWLPGLVLWAVLTVPLYPADPVYSGPQPGEKITSFKVLALDQPGEARERDPVRELQGTPTALVFIHTIERSLVPLLRVIDRYGAERKDRLKTEIIFLAADARAGEQRVRAAAGSLQLKSPVGLSPEGAEGPGNYGLNKECMMTVLTARDLRVVSNFALVQPGIVDAPRVIAALAAVCGDTNPPSIEKLSERPMSAAGAGAEGKSMRPKAGGQPAEKFPGAVPTDPTLNRLIRQIIRSTNDVATVDRLLKEMVDHVGKDADRRKQAEDGWVRVLHFGDRYGTAHAREVGRGLLERLQRERSAE